jgi:hypothetical protein
MNLKSQIAAIDALNLSAKKVADNVNSMSALDKPASVAILKQAFQRQCDVVEQLLDLLVKVIDKI